MGRLQDMVREFHEKHGFAVDLDLTLCAGTGEPVRFLQRLSSILAIQASQALEAAKQTGDERLLRSHLMIEELGELIEAMADRNETKTLDALDDLLYVLLGTGVTFGEPIEEGFEEIHRSNMTKARQVTDPDGIRLRDKGPDYRPPNLLPILQAGLAAKAERRLRRSYGKTA